MNWQRLDQFANDLVAHYKNLVDEKHGHRVDAWPFIGLHSGCDLLRTTYGNWAVLIYRNRNQPGYTSRAMPQLTKDVVGADAISAATRDRVRATLAKHYDLGPKDAVLLFELPPGDALPDYTGELRYLLAKHEVIMPSASARATIFYSWQSDLPSGTNRTFIETALENAVQTIGSDADLAVEAVIDRDTLNVPGSPEIGKTIFEKIDRADVFVADVSIINGASDDRKAPNPNVLVEVGWAMKSLGPERIVLVMNRAFGRPEDLPFDLRGRRTAAYSASVGEKDRSAERKQLAVALEISIRSAIHSPRTTGAVLDHALREIERALRLPIQRSNELVATVYEQRLKGTYSEYTYSPGVADRKIGQSNLIAAIQESIEQLASAAKDLPADQKFDQIRVLVEKTSVAFDQLRALTTEVEKQVITPDGLLQLPIFKTARESAFALQKALVHAS
jgi:hypothetical protein